MNLETVISNVRKLAVDADVPYVLLGNVQVEPEGALVAQGQQIHDQRRHGQDQPRNGQIVRGL